MKIGVLLDECSPRRPMYANIVMYSRQSWGYGLVTGAPLLLRLSLVCSMHSPKLHNPIMAVILV